jgi:xeroderma pigmentosum group C-complementing protein
LSRQRTPRRRRGDDVDDGSDDGIPEVYRQMLAEADARASDQAELDDRPIKRRRTGKTPAVLPGVQSEQPAEIQSVVVEEEGTKNILQTAYDSAVSDESDMEWEEVEIGQPLQNYQSESDGKSDELQITFNQASEQPRKASIARRKPVSATEKKLRLDIHKVHLLCLLGHVRLRNHWCNDDDAQGFLKQLLSKQTVAFLNPKDTLAQFTRSTTFIDGLRQASEAFRNRFKVAAPGWRRPHWAEDPKSLKDLAAAIINDAETILSREDFTKQAKGLNGSRDFGAQLFCALLRSAAVEARLVCSLQPLSFTGTATNTTPVRLGPQYIVVSSDDPASSSEDNARGETSDGVSPQTRRLGRPFFKPNIQKSQTFRVRPSGISSKYQESPHPIFWVEAYNDAVQKWIPVDPFVTKTVAKTSKFEPPASDRYNSMNYVVAFEEDGSARDVTRRYVNAYNAKTLKTRVESTKDGEKWWLKTMSLFQRPFLHDRDQLEIGELTARTGAEPMPRNVQDFKGHPIYALEKHLRRNEVIFPKRVIGQVGSKAGSKNEALQPVYRRADVHIVKSADGWYRLGRDIKVGKQPLKRIVVNRDENATETPLYAFSQTETYEPPPIIKGKVPKNAYGNLDIYVPGMIPSGGFHLKHPEAARAARLLGVDFADAVTGFDFKGRHGTAIFQGIVAANEYREALEEVLGCFEDEQIKAELDRKAAKVLHLWKHFLLKLRIVDKVRSYKIEGESQGEGGLHEKDVSGEDDEMEQGGGFFLESDLEPAEPARTTSANDQYDSFGGGFVPEMTTESTTDAPVSLPTLTSSSMIEHSRTSVESRSRYSLVVIPRELETDAMDPQSRPEVETASNLNHPNEYSEINSHQQQCRATPGLGMREAGGSSTVPITIGSSSGVNSASIEIMSRSPSQAQSRTQSPGLTLEDSNSDTERLSLLSRDPDDDDAEPEWLMSD